MWLNPQEIADLVTFTEEILNGKLYFLCNESSVNTLLDTFAWFKLKLLKKDKFAQETIVSNNELIFSKYRKYLSYSLEQFVRVEVFCLQHVAQGRWKVTPGL